MSPDGLEIFLWGFLLGILGLFVLVIAHRLLNSRGK